MIAAGVTVDPKDPNRYIVSVGFEGMGLPDRDFYLVDNERNKTIHVRMGDQVFRAGKSGANWHFSSDLLLPSEHVAAMRAA